MARKMMPDLSKLPCFNKKKGEELPHSEMGILQDISGLETDAIHERWDSFTRLAKTGELDQNAFETLFRTFVSSKIPMAMAGPIFHIVDSNQDGGISFREFLGALSIGNDSSQASRLKSALKVFKWTQGAVMPADKVTNLLENVADLAGIPGDKGFSHSAIRSLVNLTKNEVGHVDVGELANKIDTMSHFGF